MILSFVLQWQRSDFRGAIRARIPEPHITDGGFMKRHCIILFLILMIFSLSACGKEKNNENTPASVTGTAATPAGNTPTPGSTATPTLSPTPTSEPTPEIPGIPDGYSEDEVVKMMDDEIDSMKFAYWETVTQSMPTDMYPEAWVHKYRETLSADPKPYDESILDVKITYNREVHYLDADLKPCKTVIFLNDLELAIFYETTYGRVIDYEGARYYCMKFSVYDDAGRLIYQKDRLVEYCCSYDPQGNALVGAEYQSGNLFSYGVNYRNDDGSVAAYSYYSSRKAWDPELTFRSIFAYDDQGNCVAMDTERFDDYDASADYGRAAGHYEFMYTTDSYGRLSGRTIRFTAPNGKTQQTTIGFKYYDDGTVLVYGRDPELYNKQYYDLGDMFFPAKACIVFLPDTETSKRLTNCSGLMPMFLYSECFPSDDPTAALDGCGFYDLTLCSGTPLRSATSGVAGLLDLPEAQPEDFAKCLLKIEYTDGTYNNVETLLTLDRYDAARIKVDDLAQLNDGVITLYHDNGNLAAYMLSDAMGNLYVFIYDENGRLTQATKRDITTVYHYDRSGNIVGWNYQSDSTRLSGNGQLQYDAGGRLTLMTSNVTDRETGYRTTIFLTEYNGDGNK